jgi:hypothetical protein
MRWLAAVSISGLALALCIGGCRPAAVAYAAPRAQVRAQGVDPTLTVAPSAGAAARGSNVTFTYLVSVPSSEAKTAYAVVLTVPLGSAWQFVSGAAPKTASNAATLDYQDATGTAQPTVSASAVVRITGETQSVSASGANVVVPLGMLAPGESATVTLTLKLL